MAATGTDRSRPVADATRPRWVADWLLEPIDPGWRRVAISRPPMVAPVVRDPPTRDRSARLPCGPARPPALIVEALGGEMPVSAYRSLYGAEPDAVLQYVREIDEGVASALLVGHNPTVFEVAWQLLADRPARSTRRVGSRTDPGRSDVLEAHGFPTCALAVLALAVTAWEDAAHGCGHPGGLFTPPY